MADRNITVKIRGDSSNLSRAVQRSTSQLRGFGQALRNFGRTFGPLGAALTGGGAILGGGFGIRVFADALEEVDNLTKLGRQFGVGADQVQVFQRAAGLTGTRLEQLLKGFQNLNRAAVQFVRDGTGPGQKAFKDLGITADQLAGAIHDGPVALLRLFGKGLQNVDSDLKRNALLTEVLGSRNSQLAVALEDVDQNFGAVAEDLKRLGLTLTPAETADVEKLRDTFFEIANTIENRILKGIAQIAPSLQPAADAAKELVEAVTGEGGEPGFFAPERRGARQRLAAGAAMLGPPGQAAAFALGIGPEIPEAIREIGRTIIRALPGSLGEAARELTGPGRDILGNRALAPGTGTINNRSLEEIRSSSERQKSILEQSLDAQRQIVKNTSTGRAIAVAAP